MWTPEAPITEMGGHLSDREHTDISAFVLPCFAGLGPAGHGHVKYLECLAHRNE